VKQKVLIICGPTGVGKTGYALEVAKKYNGELVSADSRQVYKGMDIITGKDLPDGVQCSDSNVQWADKKLCYYKIQDIKVWLYDIVNPDEEFNVSFWKECAQSVIEDILSRGKLPIIVGGTGLYIKSLTHNLGNISVPPDPVLRNELSNKTAEELFDFLKNTDLVKAESLNNSDKHNPRRLLRAIEISGTTQTSKTVNYNFLQIGLSLPTEILNERIEKRVEERKKQGARQEYELLHQKYNSDLPSMTGIGYRNWVSWVNDEKNYAKRQMTWFKKYPKIHWSSINEANVLIQNWYMK
jgi:tRNA dimethylallyltransferase